MLQQYSYNMFNKYLKRMRMLISICEASLFSFLLQIQYDDQCRTHSSFSSLHFLSFNSSESSLIPESSSLLLLKSSSLRCEGFDLRAEARAAQPSS